jgi:prepilin-type N-terminal cleavage/methylation domain-containing protein
MKKQSGFTLIELLLVLAIIGIISAIAIPALLGQRERAKAKAVQANVNSIAGEMVRVNDTAKEAGSVLAAGTIVTSVLTMSNFSLATAKNPYNGSLPAYVASGGVNGQVQAVGAAVTDITGSSYSAVTITGSYLIGGVATTMIKVVALD